MSRRRYLSTKISQDAKINRLATQHGDFAALLYTWMIPHAEDDGTLTGDPDELLMTVVPGRRDKTAADITAALDAMCALDLIEWERDAEHPLITFPPSFYSYQSYIGEKRRTAAEGAQVRKQASSRTQNSADDNASAQNAANQRKSAQNASSFSSLVSSSVSVSPPSEGAPTADADEPLPAADVSAPAARSVKPSSSAVALPARRKSDTTDRIYWTRILKEAADNERIPLLVRMPHDRLTVDDSSGSPAYGRIGKLAKQHGAALVASWILQAAAGHIDGDPLSYLVKVAEGQIARASPRIPVAAAARAAPPMRSVDDSVPEGY